MRGVVGLEHAYLHLRNVPGLKCFFPLSRAFSLCIQLMRVVVGLQYAYLHLQDVPGLKEAIYLGLVHKEDMKKAVDIRKMRKKIHNLELAIEYKEKFEKWRIYYDGMPLRYSSKKSIPHKPLSQKVPRGLHPLSALLLVPYMIALWIWMRTCGLLASALRLHSPHV